MLQVLLGENARLPTRGSKDACAIDFYNPGTVTLRAGKVTKFPLNISVAIPKGCYGKLETRSSYAAKGLVVLGGVIDADYRGVIGVLMLNTNEDEPLLDANGEPCLDENGKPKVKSGDVTIDAGDRCCQMIVHRYVELEPMAVAVLTGTERGTGGFGSTGK